MSIKGFEIKIIAIKKDKSKMDKALDIATNVAPAVISMATNVAILAATAYGGKTAWEKAQDYWI